MARKRDTFGHISYTRRWGLASVFIVPEYMDRLGLACGEAEFDLCIHGALPDQGLKWLVLELRNSSALAKQAHN